MMLLVVIGIVPRIIYVGGKSLVICSVFYRRVMHKPLRREFTTLLKMAKNCLVLLIFFLRMVLIFLLIQILIFVWDIIGHGRGRVERCGHARGPCRVGRGEA